MNSGLSSSPSPVRARDLCKQVTSPDGGTLTLLDHITLELASGEATAIVGASGSGKSTLLGLLAGLDRASSGSIELFGQPLEALDEDQRAALRAGKVGFVFQSFQLLPGMTALENVLLPLELAGADQAAERARDALAQVGLERRLHHYPNQLSGGEQQRVAIARAFAPEPRLLFADEPTGSLDQRTGERISELLFAQRQRQGSTLLLVTHDDALAANCDSHLQLDAGQLVTPT